LGSKLVACAWVGAQDQAGVDAHHVGRPEQPQADAAGDRRGRVAVLVGGDGEAERDARPRLDARRIGCRHGAGQAAAGQGTKR